MKLRWQVTEHSKAKDDPGENAKLSLNNLAYLTICCLNQVRCRRRIELLSFSRGRQEEKRVMLFVQKLATPVFNFLANICFMQTTTEPTLSHPPPPHPINNVL